MRVLYLFIASFLITPAWETPCFSENSPHSYASPLEASQKAEDFQKKESKLRDELDELDGKLRKLYSQIEQLSEQRERIKDEQAQVRKELKQVQKDLEKTRKNAGARLVALYKFKQVSYAAPLFAAEDFRSAIEAGYVMAKLILCDHRFFLRLRENYSKINSMERFLSDKEEELKTLQAQLKGQRQELIVTKDKEVELLVKIRQQRKLYAQRAEIVAEAEVAVEKNSLDDSFTEAPGTIPEQSFTVKQASVAPPPSKDFSSFRRGGLPLPTEGRITKGYGSKKGSPYHTILYNNGIIIEAPKGQPVQAIHEGVVVFADWFKNYGKVMIIDHGDRYHSLIAHADQLYKKAGEKVEPKETIATVGDTASKDGPKLYFEIRHHGQPIDPMPWLVAHKLTKK